MYVSIAILLFLALGVYSCAFQNGDKTSPLQENTSSPLPRIRINLDSVPSADDLDRDPRGAKYSAIENVIVELGASKSEPPFLKIPARHLFVTLHRNGSVAALGVDTRAVDPWVVQQWCAKNFSTLDQTLDPHHAWNETQEADTEYPSLPWVWKGKIDVTVDTFRSLDGDGKLGLRVNLDYPSPLESSPNNQSSLPERISP